MTALSVLQVKDIDQIDLISCVRPLTLDELFDEASKLGKLETGRWGHANADLTVNFADGDYVSLKSDKYCTLKENIAEVIHKARLLRSFYKQNF